ncbi:DUF4383 domain-containing protein [Kineococcus terrestris]|uniref:DUF4383 domain-containing protein n=1 Tax=Kineococcus terrestris TaxID=2044856 RepID=UPI0034DB7A7B
MSLDASGRTTTARPRTTAGQHLSLVAAVVLLLVGVAGFAVSGFTDWTRGDLETSLLEFTINPLTSAVFVVVGALGLLGRRTARLARWYGVLLALVMGALAVFGYSILGDPEGNPFNINYAMTALLSVVAALGILIALVPTRLGKRPSTVELD